MLIISNIKNCSLAAREKAAGELVFVENDDKKHISFDGLGEEK